VSGHSLNSLATHTAKGSVITWASKSSHLDCGARVLMVIQTIASATPNP
jgi:hypothetical protein